MHTFTSPLTFSFLVSSSIQLNTTGTFSLILILITLTLPPVLSFQYENSEVYLSFPATCHWALWGQRWYLDIYQLCAGKSAHLGVKKSKPQLSNIYPLWCCKYSTMATSNCWCNVICNADMWRGAQSTFMGKYNSVSAHFHMTVLLSFRSIVGVW